MKPLYKEFNQFKEQFEHLMFWITSSESEDGKLSIIIYGEPILEFQETNRLMLSKVLDEINLNLECLSKSKEKTKYLKGILFDLEKLDEKIFWEDDIYSVANHYSEDIIIQDNAPIETLNDDFKEQISTTIFELKNLYRQIIAFVKKKLEQEDIITREQSKPDLLNDIGEPVIEVKESKNEDMELITEKEVAKILGISVRTLQNLRYDKAIEHISIGRSIRYSREAIRKYCEEHKTKPIY